MRTPGVAASAAVTAARLWRLGNGTLTKTLPLTPLRLAPAIAIQTAHQEQYHTQHRRQQELRLLSTTPQVFGAGGHGHGSGEGDGHTNWESTGGYRESLEPERKWVIWAEIFGAYMWWWIFWHLFTDYGHIIGEFDFPDTDAWSDEELGVPALNED